MNVPQGGLNRMLREMLALNTPPIIRKEIRDKIFVLRYFRNKQIDHGFIRLLCRIINVCHAHGRNVFAPTHVTTCVSYFNKNRITRLMRTI